MIVSLSFSAVHAQKDILVFKKRNRTISNFWKGSTIAFQLNNLEWQKGEIVKISNDSFYIRPMVVKYNWMGTDTFHFSVVPFSASDIYAMPKKGVLLTISEDVFKYRDPADIYTFIG